jgi:hypothetical protein
MAPHRRRAADRRRNDRPGRERGQAADEARIARADPRDDPPRLPQVFGATLRPATSGVRLALVVAGEEDVEAERIEVDPTVYHAERRQQAADARLRAEDERLAGPAPPERAQRRNRQQDVAERAGMDGERQGRKRDSTVSWSRPFVAIAELV